MDAEPTTRNAATDGKGRRQLVALFAIAFVTLGASYVLFYLASSGSGWGTTNKGEFVAPATTVKDIELELPAQDARHWWLWIAADDCDAACLETVEKLQALHVLLNREAGRLRRGITLADGADDAGLAPFTELRRLSLGPAATAAGEWRGIYIIDPNGNLVFRYGMDVNPKDVLQDLKRLLKVSQIG